MTPGGLRRRVDDFNLAEPFPAGLNVGQFVRPPWRVVVGSVVKHRADVAWAVRRVVSARLEVQIAGHGSPHGFVWVPTQVPTRASRMRSSFRSGGTRRKCTSQRSRRWCRSARQRARSRTHTGGDRPGTHAGTEPPPSSKFGLSPSSQPLSPPAPPSRPADPRQVPRARPPTASAARYHRRTRPAVRLPPASMPTTNGWFPSKSA